MGLQTTFHRPIFRISARYPLPPPPQVWNGEHGCTIFNLATSRSRWRKFPLKVPRCILQCLNRSRNSMIWTFAQFVTASPDILYKLVRRIDLIQYVIAKHFWQVTIRKWDQEVQALLGTTLYLYCATFWAMRLFYLFPAISGTYVTTSDASASGQRDREISDMKAPNWEHPLWFWTKIWSKQKISQVKNAQGNAKLFMGTLICFHTWGAIHHSHNSFN